MKFLPPAFRCLLLSLSTALLSVSVTQAARFPRFESVRFRQVDSYIQLPSRHHDVKPLPDMPYFREAPSFRNGKECRSHGHFIDESEWLCDPLSVHIAMTLDVMYIRGSVAAILSIVQHSSCPENIVFHFLASAKGLELEHQVRATFPYLRFRVYHFDENLVRDRISSSIREALEQPLNYARTYIADIVPECVQQVIYLDSDIVVVDDIAKLWNTDLGSHSLGAPEYCSANFTKYFTDTFWLDENHFKIFDGKKPCYFNTGVMVMNLNKWRSKKFSRVIEQWMDVQKAKRIYELGSLPPFLLVFAGDVQSVDHRWNQHGLGGDNFEGQCRPLHPGPVSLLHWSGKGKPWIRLDSRRSCPLDSLWAPYDLSMPFHFVLK